MVKRKIFILIISILVVCSVLVGIVAAFSLETPSASGVYPIQATVNLKTGKTNIKLNDSSIINFSTGINTQNGVNNNDYNYFVFPKVYADSSDTYYSYIGTDGYKYILTGWKVDGEYAEYFGYTDSNVTYYSEIGGYTAMWEPSVNVYQPNDWVDVSGMIKDDKEILTLSPVYGKCIYVDDPFENMYYDGNLFLSVKNPDELSDDPTASNYIKNILGFNSVAEYKEFLYYYTRKNVGSALTGSEAWKKYISFYDSSVTTKGYYYAPGYSNNWTGASDKNDGHDANNAVATMDRAYELVTARKDFSPYHYVFYMLDDWHEIRVYNGSGKPATNYNYLNGNYTYDATGTYTYATTTNKSDNTYFGGMTNKYKGVTITSADGIMHSLIKRISTYNQAWASSIRFDNVEYKNLTKTMPEIGSNSFTGQLSFGSEENLYGRTASTQKIYQVCEFTRKSKTTGWSTFRTNGAKAITVNSSGSSLTLHQCWSSSLSYLDQTVFNIGGNHVATSFYGGTMSTNPTSIGTTNGDMIINITDNAKITTFYGGCRNQKFQQTGNRIINIRGGNIPNLYGAGNESIFNGDIEINVTGGTIGNLYGGGQAYMASVFGDISINIANANITGNIYGGGQYASVMKGYTGSLSMNADKEVILTKNAKADSNDGGDVDINLFDANITGNVYGSGQGMVNSVTKLVKNNGINYGENYDAESLKTYVEYVNNKLDNCDSDSSIAWWNDEVKCPVSNEDGSITSYVYRTITGSNPAATGSTMWNWRLNLYRVDYYLSVAEVYNSNISLSGNTVVGGNVYGGGNLGTVQGDINIEISDNSEVKGTLFGGGDGTASIATITLYDAYNGALPRFKANGTSVNFVNTPSATNGSTETYAKQSSLGTFKWTNDNRLKESTLFNSIYKGSSAYASATLTADEQAVINEFGSTKYVYSSGYEDVGEVLGNINVTINNGTFKTVYGGCNRANVYGMIDVSILDGNIDTLYGGNNLGGITHKDITIDIGNDSISPKITNMFGAGNMAEHDSNVDIDVNNIEGTMDYLFGGGHVANVNGSINVNIDYGTYNYIFGGGDLAKVLGDTYVNVGDKVNNPLIKVNNVVYGGGRGSDTGADASGIITVEGNSTVWIVGMNTMVQNYGSTKLGSVAGDVNVTFDTYRKENSTNPYVTMNGIDRATTVSLINSYIALENIGENGEKEGIKNIGNLNVPAGSGLKVTATGEITGDFNGGGTFYLDSKVSLTIGGDITGITTLAINPQIATQEDNIETPLVIKGTKVYAYMIVKGNSAEGNLNCVDNRYADDIRYAYESNVGYYYLESDVGITEQISEILVSKSDINYTEDCSSWGNVQNVIVQQDGVVTTNILLNYNFSVDNDDAMGYKNISRSISIKESTINGVVKYFPRGTMITMIADGEYYKYSLYEDMEEVFLADFVKMEDSSVKYPEIKNVKEDENTIVEGKTTNSTIYSRTEEFRFVVDFTYVGQPLPVNTYIIYLNLLNNNVESEAESLLAENIIDLKKVRNYKIVLNTENREYIENDIISVNTNIWIDEIQPYETNKFLSTPLYSRVTVMDSGDNVMALPDGTIFKLGNKSFVVENGVARINLIDSLAETVYNENMTITVDMSKVQDYSLKSDVYVILFEEYLKDAHAEKIVSSEKLRFNVVRPEGATIVVNLDSEKLSVTTGSNKELKVNYYGDVYNPNLKIKLQKANNSVYEDTNYAICTPTELQENTLNSIILNFEDVPSGNYRLCFEVYGYNSKLYSTSAMNVEVK